MQDRILVGLLAALMAATAPAAAGGLSVEIRYEPIPGVPVVEGIIAPKPVTPAAVGEDAARIGSPQLRAAQMGCELTLLSTAGEVAAAKAPAFDGPPNLLFFQPDSWDYPIVPSNVRGTHTVGPDLNDVDSTYFDFAVLNNGSSTASPRFYTYLCSDGVAFAGFFTESLPVGYYTYYSDLPRRIPAGSHLIAGVTDSTNTVAESLETDNHWSHSFSWRTGGALPNLTPYTPAGWDGPIVPSDVRGTHTVGPDLNDYDSTFVDFAVLNGGNATASPRFYMYLYRDGEVISGHFIDSLPPDYYAYAEDDWDLVSAGDHELGYVADTFNVVVESDEGDNHYSDTFAWRHDAAAMANLTSYRPDTSWLCPLVASSVRGNHHAGPSLNDRDTTFIDWAIVNFGTVTAQPEFYVYLRWEDVPFAGWVIDSLEGRHYLNVDDYAELFPSGTHTLTMVIDSTGVVAESNEGDNQYGQAYTWAHVAQPNLVPYAPSGWDYPVVPSNVRGTHTVGPSLTDVDTTFIDFAFANNGGATARPAFLTYLYEDGASLVGVALESLRFGTYAYVEDYPGFFTAGDHDLLLRVDTGSVVAESIETDNEWSRTFNWDVHVAVEESRPAPMRFGLSLGRNPVSGSARFHYSLGTCRLAELTVYDASGRVVARPGRLFERSGTFVCDCRGWAHGAYVAVLDSGSGPRQVISFLKM